jgi:hypothetical protein
MTTSTDTRREFNNRYPALEEERSWIDWFLAHGIEPASVPMVGGWVERDVEANEVRWYGFVLTEAGRVQVKPKADGTLPSLTEVREPWLDVQRVQLESPPLPFPEPADPTCAT